jgi:hypothetical protein
MMARGPSKFRLRDATRAARAAIAAGIKIGRIEFSVDGTIAIIPANEMTTAPIDDLDRELTEFEMRNGQG